MKKKILLFSDFSKKTNGPPDSDTLHLWVGRWDPSITTNLTPEDQKEANQFVFPNNHQQFAFRRSLLRKLTAQYIGSSPEEIQLLRGPSGKPYLVDSPLQFNLSHSKDWLAILFGWHSPVGIDIEQIRPLPGAEQIIEECLSEREKSYVRGANHLSRFWETWNRKEACLKALGLGIQKNMIDWECLGSEEAEDWFFMQKRGLWVRSYSVNPALSMALAFSTYTL